MTDELTLSIEDVFGGFGDFSAHGLLEIFNRSGLLSTTETRDDLTIRQIVIPLEPIAAIATIEIHGDFVDHTASRVVNEAA